MLFVAIAILGLVVLAGGWLGSLYLLVDKPPTRHWAGAVHGAAGLAGFLVLVAALGAAPSARAVRMGAGGFGLFSGALIAGALFAGAAILLTQLRRRPVSTTLVAAHGLLGISGYTLLLTYMTMLR